MFKSTATVFYDFLSRKRAIWVLALIPTLISAVFMTAIVRKYTLELVHEENRERSKLLTFFEDIDHDGSKERFDITNYRNKFAACLYRENETSLLRQFNFYGNVPSQEDLNMPIFNDVNKDGVKELFVFTQKNDSIFINGVDLVRYKVILKARFVTTIGKGGLDKDFVIRFIINHDSNNDGVKEMYFSINGGYALYPRKLMAYNYVEDTFLSSINTGSQHYVTPVLKDGNMLLYSATLATDNCPTDFEYPYPDQVARLFVFDDQLQLVSEPIAFEGEGAFIDGPILCDNQYHFYIKSTVDGKEQGLIIKTMADGQVIQKSAVKNIAVIWKAVGITVKGEKRYLVNCIQNNLYETYEYSPRKMALLQNKLTSKVNNSTLIEVSLPGDELAFFSVNHQYNNKTSLILDDFQYQLDFKTPLYIRPWNVYFQSVKNNLGIIIKVTDRHKLQTYLLRISAYYPFRFLLFIAVYILAVFLLLGVRHFKEYRSLQKNKLQYQISSLQLKLVNSQLDPHFTFNALNTVSSKILKGERMEAYDLMTSFSNMLRAGMFFADANAWSLKQELKFTDAFLNLMKTRFNTTFDFEIKHDENSCLKAVLIPRLLVQNFAQNAIKHAFTGRKNKGCIVISAIKTMETCLVKITDDGIGREKGRENTKDMRQESGKGIDLNRKQIALYNSLYKTSISFEINDVVKDGIVAGTEVVISVPIVTD